jgi:8-oxo-dGTP pyrophosphatase MutT (NUDIX family)/uncharacterized membrane protein YoaK (UPF0700 family)
MFAGKTQPHIYTWLIWVVTQSVAVVGLWKGGAGLGAIPLMVTLFLACFVCIFSLRYGTHNITRFDTAVLIAVLVAMIVWMQLESLLLAVVMVTAIDLVGYLPTLRKTYAEPWSETLSAWVLFVSGSTLSLFALSELNALTLTYITAITLANATVVVVCYTRRRANFFAKMKKIRSLNSMQELLLLNPEMASESEVMRYRIREASRAVVLDTEGKVALLHVSRDGYYKLPGGGLKEGEEKEAALERECLEEIGVAVEVVSELGIVTEYRKFSNLKQVSYCYFARSVGDMQAPQFTKHEQERGFEPPVWVTFEEALDFLKKSKASTIEGREYIVPRDIVILEVAQKIQF